MTRLVIRDLRKTKRYFLVCFLGIMGITLNAQFGSHNLVPNTSFESYTNCPVGFTTYDARNDKPDYWYKPDLRGARYFNACANGFSSNNNGVPINFGGGGIIFSLPKQVMLM